MKTDIDKKQLIADLVTKFGKTAARKDVIAFLEKKGIKTPFWLINGAKYRASRGVLNLDVSENVEKEITKEKVMIEEVPALQAQVVQLRQKRMVTEVENLVPIKDNNYVPFGFFKDLESIIKTKVFITFLTLKFFYYITFINFSFMVFQRIFCCKKRTT